MLNGHARESPRHHRDSQKRRSPIPLFRSGSKNQVDEEKYSQTYEITNNRIPNFNDVRNQIFPVVKQWIWLKNAKETLQCSDPRTVLVTKQISNTNVGITYALFNEEKAIRRYVTILDLQHWNIKEKELIKIAKENLIKKIGLVEKNEPLFTESQMGLYVCNKLKSLTSSLLAVTDVFNMIPFKHRNYVILCPTSDILYVTHGQDHSGLCMIGQLSIKYAQKETNILCNKPIRISKGVLNIYEPSLVRNESSVPKNEEQVESLKKTAMKKSRKLSVNGMNTAF